MPLYKTFFEWRKTSGWYDENDFESTKKHWWISAPALVSRGSGWHPDFSVLKSVTVWKLSIRTVIGKVREISPLFWKQIHLESWEKSELSGIYALISRRNLHCFYLKLKKNVLNVLLWIYGSLLYTGNQVFGQKTLKTERRISFWELLHFCEKKYHLVNWNRNFSSQNFSVSLKLFERRLIAEIKPLVCGTKGTEECELTKFIAFFGLLGLSRYPCRIQFFESFQRSKGRR